MQQAVSSTLLETIKELQSLSCLSNFYLAGGTNLAIRYNHRESQDIDLFCPDVVGITHFENIEKEVIEYYGISNISGLEYPIDKESDQYIFMRFWIVKTDGLIIKVEVIQNMKMLYPFEVVDGVNMVSTKDIGVFKLLTASSRGAKKDIYDLDFISDKIDIIDLFDLLKAKEIQFNTKEDRSIFDLDEDESPSSNPFLLLKFDRGGVQSGVKPRHSNDNILIVENSKTWISARSSWRMKVRKLFRFLNIEYPI